MKKSTMMKLHSAQSLFFLPLVLLYTITGILSLLGYDKPTPVFENEIALNWQEKPELKRKLIEVYIQDHNLKKPAGDIKFLNSQIVWGQTIDYHLKIFSDPNGPQSYLKVYEPNIYHKLLALHKNRGEPLFKWLAVLFCLSYGFVYFTGFMAIRGHKQIRNRALVSIVCGLITISMVMLWDVIK